MAEDWVVREVEGSAGRVGVVSVSPLFSFVLSLLVISVRLCFAYCIHSRVYPICSSLSEAGEHVLIEARAGRGWPRSGPTRLELTGNFAPPVLSSAAPQPRSPRAWRTRFNRSLSTSYTSLPHCPYPTLPPHKKKGAGSFALPRPDRMDISHSLPSTPSSLSFSFLTTQDINRISVKQIVNPILLDNLNRPTVGGLYDPALGPMDSGDV